MAKISITNGNNKVILNEDTNILRVSDEKIQTIVLPQGSGSSSGHDGTNSILKYTQNVLITHFPSAVNEGVIWIKLNVNQTIGVIGTWSDERNQDLWFGAKILSSIQTVQVFASKYGVGNPQKGRLNIYNNSGVFKWSDKTLSSAIKVHYVNTITRSSPNVTSLSTNLSSSEADNLYVSFVGGGVGNIWSMAGGHSPSAVVSFVQIQRTGLNSFVITKRTYGTVIRDGSTTIAVNDNYCVLDIPVVLASVNL